LPDEARPVAQALAGHVVVQRREAPSGGKRGEEEPCQSQLPPGARNAHRGPALAESEGFEPPSPSGLAVFKTAAFDHSANSPMADILGFLPLGRSDRAFAEEIGGAAATPVSRGMHRDLLQGDRSRYWKGVLHRRLHAEGWRDPI